MLSLDDEITPGQRTFEAPGAETDALFVFSSGTTGMPKAVRHTHGSFAAAVRHWRDALQLSSADRMQIMTPPSHILGLLNIVTALETRRLDPVASPVRRRHDAAPHRETTGSPSRWPLRQSHWRSPLIPSWKVYDLSSLRYIMWCATPVTAERRRNGHRPRRRDVGDRLWSQRIAGHRLQPDRRRAAGHCGRPCPGCTCASCRWRTVSRCRQVRPVRSRLARIR